MKKKTPKFVITGEVDLSRCKHDRSPPDHEGFIKYWMKNAKLEFKQCPNCGYPLWSNK